MVDCPPQLVYFTRKTDYQDVPQLNPKLHS